MPLSFSEYQKLSLQTLDEKDTPFEDKLSFATLGLTMAIGGYAEKVKNLLYHNHPTTINNIKEELGKCCLYLAIVCEAWSLSFEEVARNSLVRSTLCTVCGCDGWHSFSCTNT